MDDKERKLFFTALDALCRNTNIMGVFVENEYDLAVDTCDRDADVEKAMAHYHVDRRVELAVELVRLWKKERARLLSPTMVHCHGTYPFSGADAELWRVLKREIPDEEARTLARLPKELPATNNLWVNKAYIVTRYANIKMPYPASSWLRTGMRAIYLHDGTYALLERK